MVIYKISVNVYYANGTMNYGENNQSTYRYYSECDDRLMNKVPQTKRTWTAKEYRRKLSNETNMLSNVEVYAVVNSDFVDGITNGYTEISKNIMDNGILTKHIGEEGNHRRGVKVGRIFTITSSPRDKPEMKFEEYEILQSGSVKCGSGVSVEGYCFYNKNVIIGYARTKTSEKIKYLGSTLQRIRDQREVILSYTSVGKTYNRKVNDDGIITIDVKKMQRYLPNGTVS